MKKKTSKKGKQKLTDEQKKQKRKAAEFSRKIKNVFTGAGFDYLDTVGKHKKIGLRTVEVDSIFFYENIFLICEDTTTTTDKKEHIRKKHEAFNQIDKNFDQFISKLCEIFPDFQDKLKRYKEARILRFGLYFSLKELALSADEIALYPNLNFIEPKTLDYFCKMTQCIKLSARHEIFRYLNIRNDQIGGPSSDSMRRQIKAPIIYPQEFTGLKNGVRVVSFMMSAEILLKTCYVLRKDNWEESMWLYQRLIDGKKIKGIRNFLFNKKEAFFNNIIVALPNNVKFLDNNENSLSIDEISTVESGKIELPDEMNSICVIDGQHRIFAHYEGPVVDRQETEIAELRKQLHLLVTGLIFPEDMTPGKKAQIQSEIFLDINSNSKPVPADVLLHIEMIKDPFSDIGLTRRVVEKLNKQGVFSNKFEMSSLDTAKIKIASIIKFALRYLITLTPTKDRASLYTYWSGNKTALEKKDESALNEYIDFCAKHLNYYFSAVKANNKDAWNDVKSKLLSVIAINGFIIAYNRQLKQNGVKDFEFYNDKLKNLHVDFSKNAFPYTSSQYKTFSDRIVKEAFGLHV